jgi:glycosyltransferase involved in cell wall biosynthesis
MAKKKICMILLRHSALDDRIYYKEARTLRDGGYDVHLLCRLQNGAFCGMGGKAIGYPDKNGQWNYDGITFHGIARRKGLWGKWLEYKDLVKEGLSIKADVYHCQETDVALAAAGRIKKQLGKKTKFIFDSHEFYAGIWAYKISSRYYHLILPSVSMTERHFLKHADYLITSDIATAGVLRSYDLNRKVTVIYNSPVIHLFDTNGETSKQSLPNLDKHKVVLCHEGTFNNTRKVDVVIEIIERLKDRCILYVIGNITPPNSSLRSRIKKLTEEGSIVETGWLPYTSVYRALEPAQIGLVLRMNRPNIVAATPNKIFNYMARGIPVLADDYPGLRDIIEKYKCGILVDGSNLDNYINAIQYLIDHPDEAQTMGQRGKEAVLNTISWEKQGQMLLSIYDELLNPQPFIKPGFPK